MRALARARAAVAYYDDGIARIEDRWMRDMPSGERFRDRDHPYADDLDVFGPRSLFQLLSSCRTPMGEDRLARWLMHPSPVSAVRERQARVAALSGHIDLRERIAVVNAGRRRSIQADRLIAWAEQPPTLPPLRPIVVADRRDPWREGAGRRRAGRVGCRPAAAGQPQRAAARPRRGGSACSSDGARCQEQLVRRVPAVGLVRRRVVLQLEMINP